MRIEQSTRNMTGLWRVKPGKHLLWPRNFRSDRDRLARGSTGFVVDLNKPWEKLLCRGQERHLEPVPEGQSPEVKEITDKGVIAWMTRHGWITTKRARLMRGGKLKQNAEAQKPPRSDDLPGLGVTPSSKRRGKPKEVEDGFQSTSVSL